MFISYCTQIKNRLPQFERVFAHNIAHIANNPDTEWVVVDLDSDDGLPEFIATQLLDCPPRFHYYRASPQPYSIPVAKNFAVRLSAGDYVFNLDADNFIGDMSAKIRTRGHSVGVCCDMFRLGIYGRIGLSRKIFEIVRGYDEAFLPAAKHDVDLRARCGLIGYTFTHVDPDIPAILNAKADTIKNFESVLSWDQMHARNTEQMQKNLELANYCPNKTMTPGDFVHHTGRVIRLTKEFKNVIH